MKTMNLFRYESRLIVKTLGKSFEYVFLRFQESDNPTEPLKANESEKLHEYMN
jgi:hypothetical protein